MSAAIAILTGAGTVLLLPIAFRLYGTKYQGAELAVVWLVATTILHMASAPVANRLNIVRLRYAAVVNIVWTVLIAIAAIVLIPRYGAAGAGAAMFIAHVASLAGGWIGLRSARALPSGITTLYAITFLAASAVIVTGYWRIARPGALPNLALAAIAVAVTCMFAIFGKRQGWSPPSLRTLGRVFRQMIPQRSTAA